MHILGFPIKGLKQEASVRPIKYGVSIPWIGMDNDGCKYLEGNCSHGANTTLTFKYGIQVQDWYPPVST